MLFHTYGEYYREIRISVVEIRFRIALAMSARILLRNQAFPSRGRWHGEAVTNEVRPHEGAGVFTAASFADIKSSATEPFLERKVARSAECVTSLRDVGEILPAAKYSRAPARRCGRMRSGKFCRHKSSAAELSALDRRSQCNLNRRSQWREGKVSHHFVMWGKFCLRQNTPVHLHGASPPNKIKENRRRKEGEKHEKKHIRADIPYLCL